MFTCVLGRYVAFTVLLVSKPSGGLSASVIAAWRRSPFSGLTSYGRAGRNLSENDARNVCVCVCVCDEMRVYVAVCKRRGIVQHESS